MQSFFWRFCNSASFSILHSSPEISLNSKMLSHLTYYSSSFSHFSSVFFFSTMSGVCGYSNTVLDVTSFLENWRKANKTQWKIGNSVFASENHVSKMWKLCRHVKWKKWKEIFLQKIVPLIMHLKWTSLQLGCTCCLLLSSLPKEFLTENAFFMFCHGCHVITWFESFFIVLLSSSDFWV